MLKAAGSARLQTAGLMFDIDCGSVADEHWRIAERKIVDKKGVWDVRGFAQGGSEDVSSQHVHEDGLTQEIQAVV